MKRTFTVSTTEDECKKTITDYWKDYRDNAHFSTDGPSDHVGAERDALPQRRREIQEHDARERALAG